MSRSLPLPVLYLSTHLKVPDHFGYESASCVAYLLFGAKSRGDHDVRLELNSLLSADAGGKGMFDLGHLSHEISGFD